MALEGALFAIYPRFHAAANTPPVGPLIAPGGACARCPPCAPALLARVGAAGGLGEGRTARPSCSAALSRDTDSHSSFAGELHHNEGGHYDVGESTS